MLSFDELKERAGATDEQLLCDLVLGLFACGLFQLHVHPPRFATTAPERPRASAVARFQARTERYVTNLCHSMVHLEDDRAMRLLLALDGTRDRAALVEEMRRVVGPNVEEELDASLRGLAKMALLEA